MKIIVTGSLGHIGKPLATELVQKGHSVTVISSKQEKQKEIEAIGATAAIGSLDDVGFLTTTFTGADTVFAMVPPGFTEPDQIAYYQRLGNNYAQAIRHSGIKHVVHLSSYGAHLSEGTGFIVGANRVEGILNGLTGVSVTHLRPGYFYYNLYSFTEMIKHAGFIGTNYGGDDRLILVAPADIAAAAAEELTAAATGTKVRYIGSDDHTANEVAQILGAAIGKPDLKWQVLTSEQWNEGLVKNGVPAPIAAMLVELGASIHSGRLRADYDKNPPATLGKIKLEEFAKEFAAVFK